MYMTSIQVHVFILGLCRFVLTVLDIIQSSGQMKKLWTGHTMASRNLAHQCHKVISSCTEDTTYTGKTQFISHTITAVN
jgi:hypothetical protein